MTKAPSLLPKCGSCRLFSDPACKSPKMKPTGEGSKRILICGEAPGSVENEQGRQFVGRTGQRLRRTLDRLGCDPDKDCWFTNSIICWPHFPSGKNRTPTDKEIDWCRPTLERTIRELQPETIILLGGVPMKSFLDPRFPGAMSKGGVGRWTGWRIPCREPNAWVHPTWHPSYLEREGNPLLDKAWESHLKTALANEGRPWQSVPDERKEVRKVFDDQEAAEWIGKMSEGGIPVAFDYETSKLKPDSADARIHSCSMSDGKDTISFPWIGKAVTSMRGFLRSPIPKICSNGKFEMRWSMAKLGTGVRNMVWDCMLAMHAIDNRQYVTGLDFMAFVLLGARDWWSRLGPWLQAKRKGGNEPNRIHEVDLDSLLLYNGLDSLIEWKIAKIQSEMMGTTIGDC